MVNEAGLLLEGARRLAQKHACFLGVLIAWEGQASARPCQDDCLQLSHVVPVSITSPNAAALHPCGARTTLAVMADADAWKHRRLPDSTRWRQQ